jgi:hypothetical protein
MTSCNKEIRKAKCSSWRKYCQEINNVPSSARLMRIIIKQTSSRVSIIKPPGNISMGVPRNWTTDHRKQWDYVSGLRQTKALMKGPSAKKTREFINMNRDQL